MRELHQATFNEALRSIVACARQVSGSQLLLFTVAGAAVASALATGH